MDLHMTSAVRYYGRVHGGTVTVKPYPTIRSRLRNYFYTTNGWRQSPNTHHCLTHATGSDRCPSGSTQPSPCVFPFGQH